MEEPYYRADLARIHHLEFGLHAAACAPAILEHLASLRERGGFVFEYGCGSGALTKHLVDAGHDVLATDASPAMLGLARGHVPGGEFMLLELPEDPLPMADAFVSTGHAINYLPDLDSIVRTLADLGANLRPGGVLAIDIMDLDWGVDRADSPPHVREGDDWTLVTQFETPAPHAFVRHMSTFTKQGHLWRRDDETHHNVLVDTSVIPELLAEHGVTATVGNGFGDAEFPIGLKSVVGFKEA